MASLDGFQGHFDMLYDDERNQAYAEAIRRAAERAPSGGATALDIGSGSGLLGLLCWQTGRFHRVVLLEACPPLATAAKENIQRNGAASCCTVWEGHSNDVLHQTEAAGSQPFDLCVSELLDSVLIGEGVLDSLRHAWASPYFGPGTTLIPQRATVFGRLFWSPALFAQHRGSAIWNLPEDMQVCPGLHAAEHLHLRPFLQAGLLSFVSEAFEVFDFDFSAPCLSRRRRCAVPITVAFPEALEAHGVALWFDAQLFEDVTLSTSVEGGSGAPREHWRQAALCFRSPLKLESRLELEWHHDEDAIWVTLPRNAEKSYAGKPPMCRCGLHAGTARRRLGMTDWHMEIMEIPPGCRAAALVFGDGPQLPLLLAERGYSPVISVGRGLLNATLVQKFARHHQRSEIRVALKTGELVPLLDTAQVQGRKRPAGAMKADNETDSEDAAFDFLMLAQNLLQDYPAEHWSAFTEAWYEELSEDRGSLAMVPGFCPYGVLENP